MDIRLVKENLEHIARTNIIRVISDIIIPNIDKVDNFSDKETYFKNDIVYMFDIMTGKHKLYLCKKESVGPGPFNESDWEAYVFKVEKNFVILESEYTANADGITTCPINQPLFDYEKDILNVYHSVRGRLVKGKHWNLTPDKQSISLKGFSMYKNESLLFEVIK